VIAAAFGAAIITAIDAWQTDDGKSDLLELADRATDALARGLQELKT
jgi:MftR C-terminal domain